MTTVLIARDRRGVIAGVLARRLAGAFGLALGSAAALLTVLQAMRLAPLVVAARATPAEWLEALGWAAIASLEAVAPAAFAVAAVLTLLRWHADGELLAARAAGLAPGRLARGGVAVVLITAAALALLQSFVLPAGLARLERTWNAFVPRALAGALPAGELVEIVPGTVLWARASGGAGRFDDLMVARGAEVLAARHARLRAARGPALVVDAEDAAWRSGELSARASAVRIAIDLPADAARRGGPIARRDGLRHGRWGRGLAPVSFALVALALLWFAVLWAGRPVRLVLAAGVLVAAREVSVRAGELAAGSLGPPAGALIPVLATGLFALAALGWIARAARRGW